MLFSDSLNSYPKDTGDKIYGVLAISTQQLNRAEETTAYFFYDENIFILFGTQLE